MGEVKPERTPLGWVLYEREKAEAAGIDLEHREILYVLQVDDLRDAYAAFIEHNALVSPSTDSGETLSNLPDAPEGEPAWADVAAEDKDGLIKLAIKYLEHLIDEHWQDTLMDAILDYNSEKLEKGGNP
jgi:hypothetical protein